MILTDSKALKRTLHLSHADYATSSDSNRHGTSHIVTGDSSGMAITFTSTINLIFGSQVIVPETGVLMNDEMNGMKFTDCSLDIRSAFADPADFSIPGKSNEFGFIPSPSNFIRPGKRPFSSITPTIVEHISNQSLYYVVGAAGGSRIITSTIQNLWHVLDHNMTAPQALAQPRFHDQLIPNVVGFEWGEEEEKRKGFWKRAESGIGTSKVKGYNNATVAFMKDRGHKVVWVPQGYSSAQAIRWLWNGTWEAVGEPRQLDSGGFVI
jgi:gamma-glutamyltranspeptidase/glutathione hydrolase